MEKEPIVQAQGDYIKVESGATVIKVCQGGVSNIYHGPKPTVKREPPLVAIKKSLQRLIENRILTKKQDFGITFVIDMELHVYPFDGYAGYEKILAEWKDMIPESLRPAASNINAWNFGSDFYPNWKFQKSDKNDTSRICAIAEAYIEAMADCGYVHPFWLEKYQSAS